MNDVLTTRYYCQFQKCSRLYQCQDQQMNALHLIITVTAQPQVQNTEFLFVILF